MSNDAHEVLVRPAQSGDAGSLASILRELGFPPHIDEESFEETQARVARHLELCAADDSHVVLVAQSKVGEAAEIIGYIAVHWFSYFILKAPEGYVSDLFIRQSSRGKGVGSLLLKKVEELARERGCSRLMLLNLRTRESYERGFYEKSGWTERQEVVNFILPL